MTLVCARAVEEIASSSTLIHERNLMSYLRPLVMRFASHRECPAGSPAGASRLERLLYIVVESAHSDHKEEVMSRRVFPLLVALLLSASVVVAKSHTPKTNTRDAVKAYVDQAARFVAHKGPDCTALQSADWQAGDYYI